MEVAWHFVVELPGCARLIVQNLQQQHLPIAGERPLASEQFVEDHAQAVDIGPAIDLMRFAARLFRRQIGRRAQQFTFERHRRFVGLALGQAEVHQVRPAVGVELNVRRLHVAVYHAVLVGVIECLGHARDQLSCVAQVERA